MKVQPQEPRDLIQICTDIYYECNTIKRLDELTDEALDWHNKQVEELLDRLEARKEQTIYADFESGSVEGWTGVPVTTIEAERNKLKERDERK